MKLLKIIALITLSLTAGAQEKLPSPASPTQERGIEIVAVHPHNVWIELDIDSTAMAIDVRYRFEYRRGHVANAVLLSGKRQTERFAATTSKNRTLFLYCTTETRARQTAEILIGKGFKKVFVIEGGFNNWKSTNLPYNIGR